MVMVIVLKINNTLKIEQNCLINTEMVGGGSKDSINKEEAEVQKNHIKKKKEE